MNRQIGCLAIGVPDVFHKDSSTDAAFAMSVSMAGQCASPGNVAVAVRVEVVGTKHPAGVREILAHTIGVEA